MARITPKTVRFTQVVERSGKPQVHTLWLPPDKDPELKRAEHAHRVMRVGHGSQGGKTDVGTVGLESSAKPEGQVLIFPKSLKPFEGARIVGIKFDLVEQPKLADLRKPAHKPPARKRAQIHAAKSQRLSKSIAAALKPTETASSPPTAAKPAKVPRAKPEPAAKTKPASPPKMTAGHAKLLRQVRSALKELKSGKTVAAYQRLQHAVSE